MTGLVFPHQLFEDVSLWEGCTQVYLVEEPLFFLQYNFHQQKIAFHRASMQFYKRYLQSKGIHVIYVEAADTRSDVRTLLKTMAGQSLKYIDTVDDWLEKRIKSTSLAHNVQLQKEQNPAFLNTEQELEIYLSGVKHLFQTDFYKKERVKRGLLVDAQGKPAGGQWTYDAENRKKFPKGKIAPDWPSVPKTPWYSEAINYTHQNFGSNYGRLTIKPLYPHTFEESKAWLDTFFAERFAEFGPYEDAIVARQHLLQHALLTPMLNAGLLTPHYVVNAALRYAEKNAVPLNSLEGFVRQIIGWREFIRLVYVHRGTEERTRNYWGFTRKIPESFWQGTTGIAPMDITIKKVLETGYCHHIERLMVLGNFMLLCEFDPDEVYRWFMELFIDAYDWVMVPNVYGMSQFADGGLMSTKPYISGSNYLVKMSDYPKGNWQTIWDALFWRFMHTHRVFFLQNPRMGMLVKTFDKWPETKRSKLLETAEGYLAQLHGD